MDRLGLQGSIRDPTRSRRVSDAEVLWRTHPSTARAKECKGRQGFRIARVNQGQRASCKETKAVSGCNFCQPAAEPETVTRPGP